MATSPYPIMTHSMTTPCPDPSHRLGLAHPVLGPHLLLDFTSHRHLKLRVSKTGLIALQTCSSCRAPFSAKAPPSTRLCTPETYEPPLTPPSSPSVTFFFTSQISYVSTSHCHHPSPCPITSSPPASLLTCYPCSLATYQFLLYAMFLLAQGLCTC